MPTFRTLVVAVLVMVIFVGGGFTAYQVADLGQKSAARGDAQTVTNETHVQQIGEWQFVDKSTEQFTAGFNDTVTVYNNSSTELTAGTDYEWNDTDGTVFFYSTANTTDGDPYNITYQYFQNTEDVKDLSGPLSVITEGAGQLAYFASGLALVVFLIGFGALIANYLGDEGPRSNR